METTLTTTTTTDSITVSVTYTKGPIVCSSPEFKIFGVDASFGSARGLVWVEDEGGSRPMTTDEFRILHPTEDDRRARVR